ncbi:serine hydrolase domain-containing protein [Sphingobacterium hotanense]|uniref:Beta-lactamase family protein n=1 Tax=Sphingobacterium hotanense TaxID=649196 RepID=A0ABT7NMZ7_9SPHI|nr:serine hydrolase domain-containing protein [Sphingobacterium hotanense]MCT1523465.1 beta-lactamase family protein [Sphingobacterium hotanense]MDM1048613.1 beta-lactamase family protein [Sphingobacterium hotanense]
MNFRKFSLALGIAVFALASCGGSPEAKQVEEREKQEKKDSISLIYNPAEADQQIDSFMQNLHKRAGFNGNVLVAKKGKILYQNSFGWANHLLKDSLNINSQFELASVSKPMTALGVLILAEQGKLKLTDSVEQYYPDFPYKGITIQQLLSHRSGLPNYVYFAETVWPDRKKGMTNQDAMSLLIQHHPGRYGAPDGRFHYNNSNYMVLGSIIEKVSGKDFAVFMKENVFDPAGMKNTNVYSKAVYEKIPTHVVGHDKVWRRSVVQNYLDGPVGDKGIYSTVRDLYKLDLALRDGRVLGKALQDSSFVPRSDAKRSLFSYGYGWRTFNPPGNPIVYHTGWWHGFKSLFVRDLKNDVTIVLLTNMANGSLNNLDNLYKILEIPILRQNAYNANGEFVQ